MKVTIMYRSTMDGGDGWVYYPKTITIGDYCPVCGAKRGERYNHRFCEDGEWFDVDRWDNPCGHIDMYAACYAESKKIDVSDRYGAYLKCVALLTAFLASVIMANGQDSLIIKCDSLIKVHGQWAALSGLSEGNRVEFYYRWVGGFRTPPLLGETFIFYPNGKRIGRRFVYCIKK